MNNNEIQPKSTVNYLLLGSTFFAGVILWLIGEVAILFLKEGDAYNYTNPVINGAYFAFLLLFTIIAVLLSENRIHSIVSKCFFEDIVVSSSMKFILILAFIAMLLLSGFLEFVYEYEPSLDKDSTIITKETTETIEIQDFYFVIDDSGSPQHYDPRDVRSTVLREIITEMKSDKRIALVSFGYGDMYGSTAVNTARILQNITLADDNGKNEFQRHLNKLDRVGGTTDILTALGLNVKQIDKGTKRSAITILVTDGDQSEIFPDTPTAKYIGETYSQLNVPIYSIFLGSQYTDNLVSFLESFSNPTGGRVVLVDDLNDFKKELSKVITTAVSTIIPGHKSIQEPLRDMLETREGKKENSILYALMHIGFIMIIGLLMGYLLYAVFSHKDLLKPFILGGASSGLLAGLVLEISLQIEIIPNFLVRLLACVILSTITWLIAYYVHVIIYNPKNKRGLLYFVNDKLYKTHTGENLFGYNINNSHNEGIFGPNKDGRKDDSSGSFDYHRQNEQ